MNQRYFQGALTARANRKGTTRGCVRRYSSISHTWQSIRPRALTQQSSLAVTHLHSGCCSFCLLRRGGILSRDCLLRGVNPDLLNTSVNMRQSGYNDLTN